MGNYARLATFPPRRAYRAACGISSAQRISKIPSGIYLDAKFRVINAITSQCLGAAGQIKRLVFAPRVHPNEGMGNSSGLVRVETVS